jgi:peptide chain release factor 2
MNDQEFWQDKNRSEDVLREVSALKSRIEPVNELRKQLDDNAELLELAREENEESLIDDVAVEITRLEEKTTGQEISTLFSGADDGRDAILTIHPGAGGTESQDWAEMLLRMYVRFAGKKGFTAKLLEVTPGDEAGIKSASVEVRGVNVYGHLKAESGVHRLVRISPFDANSRRHTSFASVFVYPEVDASVEVEIRDDDLQTDTYRASGAGGQHVNKTDSAVRITHKPSGIVVQCQSERSQHRNKETAMKMLRAKLYARKQEEERAKMDKMLQSQADIAWGNQIRSYVLHPYNMVKDHRTDEQTSDVQKVLDGDLGVFIEAYLLKFTTT